MKRFFIVSILTALFMVASFCYVGAQSVDPRLIDTERTMLQQAYDGCWNHTNDRACKYPIHSSYKGDSKRDRIKAAMDELDSNPDLYFHKKQGR